MSVVIPASSRSWIGKAHLIEATLQAVYIPQPTLTPTSTEPNEWVILRNGTPASCVQLGLYNLFPENPPVDLVVSGPNHGRNASTIYNLSSGTVGGALEAATCGTRAIAISFGSKDPQSEETIAAAARLAVRVVLALVRNWDERVELYNLNVPMRADVESRAVRYTTALPYSWSRGVLYSEVQGSGSDHVNGHDSQGDDGGDAIKQRTFKWSAELSDMKKALQAAQEGTDAHTVLNGYTRYCTLPPHHSLLLKKKKKKKKKKQCELILIKCHSSVGEFLAYSWSGRRGGIGLNIDHYQIPSYLDK